MKGALVARPAVLPRKPVRVLEARPPERKRWSKLAMLILVWGSLVIRGFALRVEARGESAKSGIGEQIVSVKSEVYCSAVAEGQEAYRHRQAQSDSRALERTIRQYGGEVLKPGARLELEEEVESLALVRVEASRMLCYMPKEELTIDR